MEKTELVPVKEFCSHHHVEIRFIEELADYGLLETKVIKKTAFFHQEQLRDLEKFVRLHQDLQINTEGLHAVNQLLNRMEALQDKIRELENTISFYDHPAR